MLIALDGIALIVAHPAQLTSIPRPGVGAGLEKIECLAAAGLVDDIAERHDRAGLDHRLGARQLLATLGPGDDVAFMLICAASGIALGADLALPAALVAGLVGRRPCGSDRRRIPPQVLLVW